MFTRLNLYTADGEFAGTVTVPLFKTRPDVLLWGYRVFRWDLGRYREAFAFTIVPSGLSGPDEFALPVGDDCERESADGECG